MAAKKKSRGVKAKQLVKAEGNQKEQHSYLTPSGIRAFIQEVKAEFQKIAWPTKKVTTGLTGFVVLLVVIIATYLGTVDLLLGKLVTFIINS
ncbi:preprotein translocase subunit SecE [Desulfogranum japonicum]|uniref:preprotein translocase subunit SecE n=1 Tax=Desulfogranum japonicum TaxID=231447 RepID=UPI00048B96C3|nr:preprotein translocase subunit SecE [Desulfogranum japonicum]